MNVDTEATVSVNPEGLHFDKRESIDFARGVMYAITPSLILWFFIIIAVYLLIRK